MIKANKGIWWMPWHQAPKKDVAGCDKLRVVASKLRTADFRMRELTYGKAYVTLHESIV